MSPCGTKWCADRDRELEAQRQLVTELAAALLVVTNTDDHADPEVRATVRAALAKVKP